MAAPLGFDPNQSLLPQGQGAIHAMSGGAMSSGAMSSGAMSSGAMSSGAMSGGFSDAPAGFNPQATLLTATPSFPITPTSGGGAEEVAVAAFAMQPTMQPSVQPNMASVAVAATAISGTPVVPREASLAPFVAAAAKSVESTTKSTTKEESVESTSQTAAPSQNNESTENSTSSTDEPDEKDVILWANKDGRERPFKIRKGHRTLTDFKDDETDAIAQFAADTGYTDKEHHELLAEIYDGTCTSNMNLALGKCTPMAAKISLNLIQKLNGVLVENKPKVASKTERKSGAPSAKSKKSDTPTKSTTSATSDTSATSATSDTSATSKKDAPSNTSAAIPDDSTRYTTKGIQNGSIRCYCISTIQFLYSIPPFRQAIRLVEPMEIPSDVTTIENDKPLAVVSILQRIMKQLDQSVQQFQESDQATSYSITALDNNDINMLMALFVKERKRDIKEQQDARDFMEFILEQIDEIRDAKKALESIRYNNVPTITCNDKTTTGNPEAAHIINLSAKDMKSSTNDATKAIYALAIKHDGISMKELIANYSFGKEIEYTCPPSNTAIQSTAIQNPSEYAILQINRWDDPTHGMLRYDPELKIDVEKTIELGGETYQLFGAILYSGNGARGHYVFERVGPFTTSVLYNDGSVKSFLSDSKNGTDGFSINQNGYLLLYQKKAIAEVDAAEASAMLTQIEANAVIAQVTSQLQYDLSVEKKKVADALVLEMKAIEKKEHPLIYHNEHSVYQKEYFLKQREQEEVVVSQAEAVAAEAVVKSTASVPKEVDPVLSDAAKSIYAEWVRSQFQESINQNAILEIKFQIADKKRDLMERMISQVSIQQKRADSLAKTAIARNNKHATPLWQFPKWAFHFISQKYYEARVKSSNSNYREKTAMYSEYAEVYRTYREEKMNADLAKVRLEFMRGQYVTLKLGSKPTESDEVKAAVIAGEKVIADIQKQIDAIPKQSPPVMVGDSQAYDDEVFGTLAAEVKQEHQEAITSKNIDVEEDLQQLEQEIQESPAQSAAIAAKIAVIAEQHSVLNHDEDEFARAAAAAQHSNEPAASSASSAPVAATVAAPVAASASSSSIAGPVDHAAAAAVAASTTSLALASGSNAASAASSGPVEDVCKSMIMNYIQKNKIKIANINTPQDLNKLIQDISAHLVAQKVPTSNESILECLKSKYTLILQTNSTGKYSSEPLSPITAALPATSAASTSAKTAASVASASSIAPVETQSPFEQYLTKNCRLAPTIYAYGNEECTSGNMSEMKSKIVTAFKSAFKKSDEKTYAAIEPNSDAYVKAVTTPPPEFNASAIGILTIKENGKETVIDSGSIRNTLSELQIPESLCSQNIKSFFIIGVINPTINTNCATRILCNFRLTVTIDGEIITLHFQDHYEVKEGSNIHVMLETTIILTKLGVASITYTYHSLEPFIHQLKTQIEQDTINAMNLFNKKERKRFEDKIEDLTRALEKREIVGIKTTLDQSNKKKIAKLGRLQWSNTLSNQQAINRYINPLLITDARIKEHLQRYVPLVLEQNTLISSYLSEMPSKNENIQNAVIAPSIPQIAYCIYLHNERIKPKNDRYRMVEQEWKQMDAFTTFTPDVAQQELITAYSGTSLEYTKIKEITAAIGPLEENLADVNALMKTYKADPHKKNNTQRTVTYDENKSITYEKLWVYTKRFVRTETGNVPKYIIFAIFNKITSGNETTPLIKKMVSIKESFTRQLYDDNDPFTKECIAEMKSLVERDKAYHDTKEQIVALQLQKGEIQTRLIGSKFQLYRNYYLSKNTNLEAVTKAKILLKLLTALQPAHKEEESAILSPTFKPTLTRTALNMSRAKKTYEATPLDDRTIEMIKTYLTDLRSYKNDRPEQQARINSKITEVERELLQAQEDLIRRINEIKHEYAQILTDLPLLHDIILERIQKYNLTSLGNDIIKNSGLTIEQLLTSYASRYNRLPQKNHNKLLPGTMTPDALRKDIIKILEEKKSNMTSDTLSRSTLPFVESNVAVAASQSDEHASRTELNSPHGVIQERNVSIRPEIAKVHTGTASRSTKKSSNREISELEAAWRKLNPSNEKIEKNLQHKRNLQEANKAAKLVMEQRMRNSQAAAREEAILVMEQRRRNSQAAREEASSSRSKWASPTPRVKLVPKNIRGTNPNRFSINTKIDNALTANSYAQRPKLTPPPQPQISLVPKNTENDNRERFNRSTKERTMKISRSNLKKILEAYKPTNGTRKNIKANIARLKAQLPKNSNAPANLIEKYKKKGLLKGGRRKTMKK